VKSAANVRGLARSASTGWALVLLIVIGLIIRLFFISSDGFKNDVSSFEGWALTLAEHPFSQFYGKAGFADYPPGYFYILAIVGGVWEHLFKHVDPAYGVLKLLVKLPAILADLLVGILLFRIVRRFASDRWALGAAALYLLNPAVIFISAVWGQVDAIAGGFALFAISLLLCSQDVITNAVGVPRPVTRQQWYIIGAWLAFGYCLLIKPQAAILAPLFIAFAFVGGTVERRNARLIATGIGIIASLGLALVLTLPFHPTGNPFAALDWLYQRYAYGRDVYAFNSVNAFNLWSIHQGFWQPDNLTTLFIPQYWWGIGLLFAAAILIVWRYIQVCMIAASDELVRAVASGRALLESSAILLLAFFMLSTRMHERYLFDGALFTMACIPFAWRYVWSAVILSATLFANLVYSLNYLNVVTQNLPGDGRDLWGFPDHLLSLVNVAVFFTLGYLFLGANEKAALEGSVRTSGTGTAKGIQGDDQGLTAPIFLRTWFNPAEGLIGMRGWIDYAVATALGVGSFILSFVNYWLPNEKIFDEIYFARAGEEYLTKKAIYESTHPPLTKLLVTLSMTLFGGMHAHTLGDTPYGWRFLDVLFGAFVVVLLYVFAKRVTGSTVFAAIASLLLVFDGMHFVQSRIATPEGFVVFFSLAAVYAFYRFWIASQVNVRTHANEKVHYGMLIAAPLALCIGLFGSWLLVNRVFHQSAPATIVLGLYVAVGIYLLLRLFVLPRFFSGDDEEISYPEGSYAIRSKDGSIIVHTVDGGTIDSRVKAPQRGEHTQGKSGELVYDDGELDIAYHRDASVKYTTPGARALYTPGSITTGTTTLGTDARVWLVLFTVALGCLVSSKWYGVMGFGVSFIVVIAVWLQQYFYKRPLLWGNPRGFRIDVALAAILFISGTVYGLSWTRDLIDHADITNATDVINRQYSMFEYHENLVATHPYSSLWWQWPLDARPIAYYYKDLRNGSNNPKACCVAEVISLPNPLILWFGLLCVPFVAFLAWWQRNKAYALIVLTYLLQWLPWMRSPRITFAYHFYVDIPLICLSIAIALQWIWNECKSRGTVERTIAAAGITVYVAAVICAFIWFYPILAGTPIPWNAWDARMWHSIMGNDWI